MKIFLGPIMMFFIKACTRLSKTLTGLPDLVTMQASYGIWTSFGMHTSYGMQVSDCIQVMECKLLIASYGMQAVMECKLFRNASCYGMQAVMECNL